MAGLSMGGSHTIRFGLTTPSCSTTSASSRWASECRADRRHGLRNRQRRRAQRAAEDLDLVYYAMGTDDFLYGTVAPTRAMFAKYGIHDVYHESGGGHTWINWRRYLADFAPRLFR
jgi:enterochelin esterase family protein